MYQGNYLVEKLRAASLEHAGAVFATLPDGTSLSYDTFFTTAEQFAATLQAQGVLPGDRVAVQLHKSIDVLALYIATLLAGGVFLPLNPAYTASEVTYFLKDATPRSFVCDPATLSALTPVCHAAGVAHITTLDAQGKGSFKDQVMQQTTGFTPVKRQKSDLAAILYTSGTTGRSKGAMLSHGNLWSNAEVLKHYWHFQADDRLIHALPIFHTHGLFVATNTILAAGASLIFLPKFDPEEVLAAMRHATVLMGVPTFYVRLLKQQNLDPEVTQKMRLFISGSAPLQPETHRQWQVRTGHQILERYGMTETNMNSSNPYKGARRAGTIGYPLPGVEMRIMVQNREAAVNEIGSIEVRGAHVFQGYWQMPEKTKSEMREDGFFITGDLGKIDEQGYISLIGRSKDLIITGGYNVYPKEVELLLDNMPEIAESAVIGLPHPDLGETVCAVIILEEKHDLTQEIVISRMQENLARFKLPKKIIFLAQLPRNAMGKVQKNNLRARYQTLFMDPEK